MELVTLDMLVRRHREAVDLGLAPVDGVPEALAAPTPPTCAASGGSHEKTRHTLGRTSLYGSFEGRFHGAGEAPRDKPAPALPARRPADGRRPGGG
ncbi:hypothetical protein AB0E83_09125 [Streptomyces sp. NPDC035033]|uniref:hypothetical protein n=1 Tax=Streptomyces sp. NPDC035033 TaxID=3155368 RepID=UPI0033FB7FA4